MLISFILFSLLLLFLLIFFWFLLFSIFISYLHYLDLFWWLFSLIFYYILVFFLYFFIYFILYFKWLFSLIFIYFSFLISFILFGVTPNHLQEYHFLIIFLFIYFLFLFGLLLLSSGLGLTGEIMKGRIWSGFTFQVCSHLVTHAANPTHPVPRYALSLPPHPAPHLIPYLTTLTSSSSSRLIPFRLRCRGNRGEG